MAAPRTSARERKLLHTMSAWISRTKLAGALGSMFEGKREVHEVLGYKQALTYSDFMARYLRQDIAARLVGIYPEATWGMPPQVVEEHEEGEDAEAPPTPFEDAWTTLTDRLHIFTILERADMLARLGHYSVILLGLRGQANLQAPAAPVRTPDDLIYLQLYSEESAAIERFEENAALPTYRQPTLYRVTTDVTPVGSTARQVLVHASRVIHVPGESLLEDDIYGIPALEKIYDNLDDLLMIRGGDAYGWWRDAKRSIALTMRDNFAMSPADAAAMQTEIEEYDHQMRNFLRLQGMDATVIRGEAPNPMPHITMELDLILAACGIPKRIFMGSERGELASSQDERDWLSKITRRQVKYAEARLLRPLLDRCLLLRVLPAPAERYLIQWENLLSLSEKEQSDIAKNVAAAVRTVVGQTGDFREAMSMEQFVEEYLGVEFTGQESEDLLMLAPSDEGQPDEMPADESPDEETTAPEEDAA